MKQVGHNRRGLTDCQYTHTVTTVTDIHQYSLYWIPKRTGFGSHKRFCYCYSPVSSFDTGNRGKIYYVPLLQGTHELKEIIVEHWNIERLLHISEEIQNFSKITFLWVLIVFRICSLQRGTMLEGNSIAFHVINGYINCWPYRVWSLFNHFLCVVYCIVAS